MKKYLKSNYSVFSNCHSERSEESLKVNQSVEVSVKGSFATVRTSAQDDSGGKELNSYVKRFTSLVTPRIITIDLFE